LRRTIRKNRDPEQNSKRKEKRGQGKMGTVYFPFETPLSLDGRGRRERVKNSDVLVSS
jgi:hypothetical protein